MVLHQKVFLVSFFTWLGSLIGTNLLGLLCINLINQHTKPYEYGFAGITSNLVAGYLIFIYLFCHSGRGSDQIYDPQKYFCDWVWFTENIAIRLFISFIFLVWMIPNIILISEPMSGVTWLVGIQFIISLIYWTGVIIYLCGSAYRKNRDIHLATSVF